MLGESVLVVDFGRDVVKVLVDRLLYEEDVRVDLINMILHILQSDHPLLDLPVRPYRLNTVSSSFLDNLINWQLWSTLPPLVSFECIFDGSYSCHSFQESLEEEDHLLVFVYINTSIVVKNIEANLNQNIQVRRFKHQKVLVLILKYKLVDEWILL